MRTNASCALIFLHFSLHSTRLFFFVPFSKGRKSTCCRPPRKKERIMSVIRILSVRSPPSLGRRCDILQRQQLSHLHGLRRVHAGPAQVLTHRGHEPATSDCISASSLSDSGALSASVFLVHRREPLHLSGMREKERARRKEKQFCLLQLFRLAAAQGDPTFLAFLRGSNARKWGKGGGEMGPHQLCQIHPYLLPSIP